MFVESQALSGNTGPMRVVCGGFGACATATCSIAIDTCLDPASAFIARGKTIGTQGA